MDRRAAAYAWGGALVAAGAPGGLLALRLATRRCAVAPGLLQRVLDELRRDALTYAYASVSTTAAFAAFGYLLGRQADRLASLSRTDDLTGLMNARGLFEHLEAELARARRERTALALLLVDLDGLKEVNDQYGHQAGDEAIRGLASVIRSRLRASDIGARWGGDEFAILAPNTPRPAAVALAERIRAAIPKGPAPWRLSGSFGVATIGGDDGGHDVDSATLMRIADAALYEAKRTGKNRVVAASPGSVLGTRGSVLGEVRRVREGG